MAREPYAYRVNSDGSRRKYMSRADYVAGRIQATGTAAARRSRINRAIGGSIT